MFKLFSTQQATVNNTTIHYRIGGSGPPLLLLHGYPQTHILWHKIADDLAKHFTVVASDLRGYGESAKPSSDAHHTPFSKREMAKDQVMLMQFLGYDQFFVAGHDRGGRVGHRMALDYPQCVLKLAVLDIAPTYTMYTTTDMEFASAYYHWFFLIQPFDLPERMIGADPDFYLQKKFGQWGRNQDAITKEAFQAYKDSFTPEMIHASCEDYRASATIDLVHDQRDLDEGNKMQCPLLCLWGNLGFVGRKYDMITEWSQWSDKVIGHGLACGHYLPEEAPEDTLKAFIEFFS